MLLVTFIESGKNRLGILDHARDEVVDLSRAAPGLPPDMLAFIALGESGLAEARRAMASRTGRLPLAQVRLMAPIPKPARNIFCVGKNYREHAQELQSTDLKGGGAEAIPELPIIFTKATSSVIGPNEPIPAWLDPTHTTDYEGELAVVIGPGGRGIARANAMRHVYGYTIVNDVTSRALQRRHQQWFLGKSLDGFCPMGPAIATADEMPDAGTLRVQTRVNGELRQDAPVSGLIFDIPTLIETLSRTLTLAPGDVIATGTPAGVGMGFKPPIFLKKGDVVAITIDPIGTLENPVA
ncbi:fumarylacetoacetate hydrolase family protein [Sulfuricaulis sp.]|jgi:2-keto-4-pentenoate hydratase/2-oxohepta-3-ene-1,7-dioic acid hydratase in catechol pathway|uniref:fumarylacetoacetate hydrolase family protein n=1 Tax=Sulfuricaulis sp. TaxID=2003553 RepID=UPI0035596AEF